jgi:hypothetical protein
VARALGGADVAMLVGLPVAGIVYLLTCRSFNIEHDRHLAKSADVGLEPADHPDARPAGVGREASPGIEASGAN